MVTQHRILLCYRQTYHVPYDAESVWAFVQRHGGYISVKAGGEYHYWVEPQYEILLCIAFPLLIRSPKWDYV
jgi:hypothetical protein